MIKIFFYIKTDKARVNGLCPIIARVVLGQKTTTISIGKLILPKRWQATEILRKLLAVDSEKILKESLDLFQLKLEKLHNAMCKFDEEVDLNKLKNRFLGKPENGPLVNLLPLFDSHNNHFLKLVGVGERSKSSHQKYLRAKELVRQFIKKQYGAEDIMTFFSVK